MGQIFKKNSQSQMTFLCFSIEEDGLSSSACQKCIMLTFVSPVEDARQPVGAFEVEKGGNSEDEEHTDQQSSQKNRGCHAWASCTQTGNTRDLQCWQNSVREETGRRVYPAYQF